METHTKGFAGRGKDHQAVDRSRLQDQDMPAHGLLVTMSGNDATSFGAETAQLRTVKSWNVDKC